MSVSVREHGFHFIMALTLTRLFYLAETAEEAVLSFDDLWHEIDLWEEKEKTLLLDSQELEELLALEAVLRNICSGRT